VRYVLVRVTRRRSCTLAAPPALELSRSIGACIARRGLALARTFGVPSWEIARGDGRLQLAGELRIVDATAIWHRLGELSQPAAERLDIDLGAVALVDGTIMSLLVDTRASLLARGTRCELVNAPPLVEPLVRLYHGDRAPQPRPARHIPRPLERFGNLVLRGVKQVVDIVVFAGQLLGAFVTDLRRINGRAIPQLIDRAGTDGIPIVVVLDFLVGFVMAFQSTRQLKLYGANIYVADIVGVSVTRELAPLMTAIIVAGRSGAAFAAELGTMRVTEEIDALRTMGLSPLGHLVAPRVVALLVIAPVLTLVGDVAGVFGGMVVAVARLGITPQGYLTELRDIVVPSDVWTGLVKSAAFGLAIAFSGCLHGLSARGAASGVGRSTTATVVSCLFSIVVIDTLFTVVFQEYGV
jgi:phospholipid/cholesterol/gamma-HCH transport system permease protein